MTELLDHRHWIVPNECFALLSMSAHQDYGSVPEQPECMQFRFTPFQNEPVLQKVVKPSKYLKTGEHKWTLCATHSYTVCNYFGAYRKLLALWPVLSPGLTLVLQLSSTPKKLQILVSRLQLNFDRYCAKWLTIVTNDTFFIIKLNTKRTITAFPYIWVPITSQTRLQVSDGISYLDDRLVLLVNFWYHFLHS